MFPLGSESVSETCDEPGSVVEEHVVPMEGVSGDADPPDEGDRLIKSR